MRSKPRTAGRLREPSTSVFLYGGVKRHAVVVSGGIYIDGPARVDRARVQINRENEVFFGSTA